MQDETLCYRNPDPCPPEWSFDNVDAGTNLCYMYVQASYSCPTNYDLTEIDGEYHCIGVPFCRNAGYTFNNTSRYCEAPACSISYSYNPIGICTSNNLCPPSATFDPSSDTCFLEIEVDEVESSPEDIANTIICTIGEDGDSINTTLNLFDQDAYDYPYASAPGYGVDPSLDGTSRTNPVCVNDNIYRAEACKWQRYNNDNEWLNSMGVPLNYWIIYGNTHVYNLTLGYLIDNDSGFSGSDNICGRDINNDGTINENEIQMCLTTPQGSLCPIDLATCETSTTSIICPENGTWDPQRNRCWKATTDDNMQCAIGSWVEAHNQCEAPVLCPPASGFSPTYSNDHDICDYPISCPDGGVWHSTRDVCETMPVCNTMFNNTRPSYNVGAQRCETPITTDYDCPEGSLQYDRDGTIICTRLPLCNPGDSYLCQNHRCERAASVSCSTGYTLGTLNGQPACYRSASIETVCHTAVISDSGYDYGSGLEFYCLFAYGTCFNYTGYYYPNFLQGHTLDQYSNYNFWRDDVDNMCGAYIHDYQFCYDSNGFSCIGPAPGCSCYSGANFGCSSLSNTPVNSPGCTFTNTGTYTNTVCSGNTQPSGTVQIGRKAFPDVHRVSDNHYGIKCVDKRSWGRYTCNTGTLSGDRCYVTPNYSCPAGYTRNGTVCYQAPICSTYGTGWAYDSTLDPDASCPTGYGLCWTNSTPVTSCPTNYGIEDTLCTHYSDHSCTTSTYQFNTGTGMCQYTGFGCSGGYTLNSIFNVCANSNVCPAGTNHDIANDVCASSRECGGAYTLSTAENLCLSFDYSCPEFYHINLMDDLCYHNWPDICPQGTDYTCMNNGGLWQCSPHICEAFNDVLEDTDTLEGENDINDIGFEDDGSCAGQIYIFRGFDKRCRTSGTTTNFVNCCSTASGDECINNIWLGFQPCNARELDLACRKRSELCVDVGEYCSKRMRLLGGSVCIEHKQTYCCFGSKFGRILQVQGRPLLKDFDPVNPFGTPQNPVCDGYTPEQFSLLDWSKIDLTELYPDIEVMPMEDYENTINTRLQDHLNNLNLPTP